MRPSNAPNTAVPIPPARGPFPTEQLDQIAGIKAEVDRENNVNKINWDGACSNWTAMASRNRDFGIPFTAKPDPFTPQVVQVAQDTDPNSGVVWLWISQGSPIVCPDLPAFATPVGPDHIHIGHKYYGAFWTAADDNTFNGTDPVPGTSDDGVTGLWQFIGSAMGKGRGWYEKKG